jgi:methanethiol S-methyltransferase
MSETPPTSSTARAVAWMGGALFVVSLLFFATCYAWAWNVPQGPDTGLTPALAPALVDVGLFSVFALHHSLFARLGVKRLIERAFAPALERSVYVWVASVLFVAVSAAWRPVPGSLWQAHGALRAALLAGQGGAALMAVLAARRLDVLELAGIRQLITAARQPPALDTDGFYGFVRHPVYLAWVLLIWLTPDMNGTRLVFALVSCAYVCLAVPFEERDLARTFGAAHDAYRRRVRWRILPGLY